MNFSLLEKLQQDVNDLKCLIEYEKNGISKEVKKKYADLIIKNLQDHLEEFISN